MATHTEEKHPLVLLMHEQGARAEDELSGATGFTHFSLVLKLTEMQRCSRGSVEDLLGSTKIPREGKQHLQDQQGTQGEGRISRVPPNRLSTHAGDPLSWFPKAGPLKNGFGRGSPNRKHSSHHSIFTPKDQASSATGKAPHLSHLKTPP